MAPSACIAQTISSLLGSAIVWAQAGLEQLKRFNIFATPGRTGFNGRQVFAKGNDALYNSLKSVTTISVALANNYDDANRAAGVLPKHSVLVFPVIVVDGRLFESYYDYSQQNTRLEESKYIRFHWKGSPAWRLHASVDIVTIDYLDEYVKNRTDEVSFMLDLMNCTRNEIAKCFETGSLDNLAVTEGPRGYVGLHRLLSEVKKTKA